MRHAWIYPLLAAALLTGFFLDNASLQIAESVKTPALDYAMLLLSSPILIFAAAVLAAILLLKGNKTKLVLPLWAAFAISWVLSYIIKFIVARPRLAEQEILGFPDYSFPSAHAALLFCLFPIISREFPEYKWHFLVFAILVSFSRIYLNAHYLSDVIAGGMLGYFTGILALKYIGRKNAS